MRFPSRAGLRAVVIAAALTVESNAQTPPSTDAVQRLEQRLDAMERKHQQELEARDREIDRLRQRIDGSATPAAPGAILNEVDAVGPATPAAGAGGAGTGASDAVARDAALRRGASFSPDIAVVVDALGSYSSNRSNDAYNRFDVREAELDLRAPIHPIADGVVIFAFERDVENPVFPDPAEPAEGPEGSVAIEEAYVFLHDFGVPNLTAKLGRFHVRFGRQNMLHLHDLPTSDPPLVNQAFLSPESLADAGLSLSYVVPPRLVGNQYVELIGEVLSGEGAASESPTLRGDVTVDSPAVNLHALWNRDLSPQWNFELGGSFLHGNASADNGQDVNLYGVDVTLMRRGQAGRFNGQLLQAEAIYGDTHDEDGIQRHSWGAYLLGQQQLSRELYAGLRLDYTQNPNARDEEAWGLSPYVSWYLSEFLRFRLQYQFRDGDVPEEHNVFVQATYIFGAHPPHPYWSMR